MAVIALLALGLTGAAQATEGWIDVGTGMRPFGLNQAGALLGGGFRAGVEANRLHPFVGGEISSFSSESRANDDDTTGVDGLWWSACAGLRADLGLPENDVSPYLSAGVLLLGGDLSFTYNQLSEDTVFARASLGGFAGGGAEVRLRPRLALGVEAGLSAAGVGVGANYDGDRGDVEPVRATWLYSDLHVAFLLGKKP